MGRSILLINGAGVKFPTPFLEITDEEFNRILDINAAAVFRSCQIFGARMLEQADGGSIVNLGSISGLGPLSPVFTYSLSKAAVHNLTKNLAREWATMEFASIRWSPAFFRQSRTGKC